MQRRRLGQLLGATAALSALPAALHRASAADPLKVGFVDLGPVGDFGWTYQHDPARKAGCTAGASWRGKPPHCLAKSTFAPRWLAASNSSCACAHAVRLDTTRTPARRNAAASRWLADGLPMACRNGPRTAMARTSLETRR